MDFVDGYFSDISKMMQVLPVMEINTMVDLLHEARLNNQQVFVMGNGGSAATATHFVCDLIKNTRVACCPDFRVIGLADNMATFSAYGNDEGYDKVFAMQLASLAKPGDVVIGISTSGNSPNVLEAMKVAREKETITIGLTGSDGGKLASLVQLNVHVPNWRPDQTEDVHLIVLHSVTAVLREMAKPTIVQHLKKAPASTFHQPFNKENSSGFLRSNEKGQRKRNARQHLVELIEQLERDGATLVSKPEMLGRILLNITESLDAASGSFALLDENARIANAALVYSGQLTKANLDQMDEFMHNGLAGWAVKNRQPALLENTRKDRRWREERHTGLLKGARSVLCVPLMVEDRVFGVITVSRPETNPFSGKEMLILTGIISAITSRIVIRSV